MLNTNPIYLVQDVMSDNRRELQWVKVAMLLSINDGGAFRQVIQSYPSFVGSILTKNQKLKDIFHRNRTTKQILQEEGFFGY